MTDYKRYVESRSSLVPIGSDKPCELHNIFNAMVASTRKRQPKQPEKKKMARYNGKTPTEHLADAKAMTLYGIKVLDETPKKVGNYWQVLIECERCGTKKWVNKNDLTRTKSCGCLKPSSAKPKIEKKVEPFDLADPVENVENIVENKTTLMVLINKKRDIDPGFNVETPICNDPGFLHETPQCNDPGFNVEITPHLDVTKSITFGDSFAEPKPNKIEPVQMPTYKEYIETLNKGFKKPESDTTDKVTVSRRLVVGLARECGNHLHDFWNLEPAAFEAAIQDAKEIYEALR